jgi:hypothetical protein
MVLDANGDFDLGSAMTLEAWVRVDVPNPGGGFMGGTTGGGGASWFLGGGISNPMDAVISVSTPSTHAVSAPGALQLPIWRHVAGTYDGLTFKIYVDGAFVASTPHPTPGSSTGVDSVVFGRFPVAFSSNFFEGAMDELRIWNVVRTDAQIQQTYMLPLVGNEAGLVGYYKFDEGGGQVIVDSSLAGNDGFLGTGGGAMAPDDPLRVPTGVPFGSCSAPLISDTPQISVSSGGTQNLSLDAGPPHAGQIYLVLGSLTGTSPGIQVDGLTLPLVFDSYTVDTLLLANQGSWQQTFGFLDGTGQASAALVPPDGSPPGPAGAVLYHAAAVFGPTLTVVFTSNPVLLSLTS